MQAPNVQDYAALRSFGFAGIGIEGQDNLKAITPLVLRGLPSPKYPTNKIRLLL